MSVGSSAIRNAYLVRLEDLVQLDKLLFLVNIEKPPTVKKQTNLVPLEYILQVSHMFFDSLAPVREIDKANKRIVQ